MEKNKFIKNKNIIKKQFIFNNKSTNSFFIKKDVKKTHININIKNLLKKKKINIKKKYLNKILFNNNIFNSKKLNILLKKDNYYISLLKKLKKMEYKYNSFNAGKLKNKIFHDEKKNKYKRKYLLSSYKKRKYYYLNKLKYKQLKFEINNRIKELHNIISNIIFFDINKKRENKLKLLNKVKNLVNQNKLKKIKNIKISLFKNKKIFLLNEFDILEKNNNKYDIIKNMLFYISFLKFKLRKLNFKYSNKNNILYIKNKKIEKQNKYSYSQDIQLNINKIELENKKMLNSSNIFNAINKSILNNVVYLNNNSLNSYLNKYILLQNNSNTKLNISLTLLLNTLINNIIKYRYSLYLKKNNFKIKLKNKFKKNINKKEKIVNIVNWLNKKKINLLKLKKNWNIKKYLFKIRKWKIKIKKNVLFGKKHIKFHKFKSGIFDKKNKIKYNILNKKLKKSKDINKKKNIYLFNIFFTLNRYNKQINLYRKKIYIINKLNKKINKQLFNLIKLKLIISNTTNINILYQINNLFNLNFKKNIYKIKKIENKLLGYWSSNVLFNNIKKIKKLTNLNKKNEFYLDNITHNIAKYDLYKYKEKLNINIVKRNLIKIYLFLLKLENKNKILEWRILKNKWIKNRIHSYLNEKRQILNIYYNNNDLSYSSYIQYKIVCLKLKNKLFRDITYILKNKYNDISDLLVLNNIENLFFYIKKNIVNINEMYFNDNKKYIINYKRGILKKKILLNIINENKKNIKYNTINEEIGILYKYANKKIINMQNKINLNNISHLIKQKNIYNKLHFISLDNIFDKKNILNVLFNETNANARYIISNMNYKILHSRSVGSLGLTKEEKKMKKWRKKLGEHLTYWVYKTLKEKSNKYDYINLKTIGKRRIIKPLFFKLKTYLKRRTFRLKYAFKKKYIFWKRKINKNYI